MTSSTENENHSTTNAFSSSSLIDQDQSNLHNDQIQPITVINSHHPTDEQQQHDSMYSTTTEIVSTDPSPPETYTTGEEDQAQDGIETTAYHDENGHRSRRSANSRNKYPSISPYQTGYYTNGHPYGSVPYYYYPPGPPALDKPTPLMFIPTQTPPPTSQVSSTSPSSARENPSGNSSSVSPQNLPPRLRQTSVTENESNAQGTGTAASSSASSQPPSAPTNSNGRRQRSILSRAYSNYYSQHPPPPLMATPPGVLYPYPPTVHPAGSIAYNIRSADEMEYLTYAPSYLGMPPPPLIWSSPTPGSMPTAGPHPSFAPYPMTGLPPPPYMFANSTMMSPASTPLNPEAAEWLPSPYEDGIESTENNILLDDEINFPPLNSAAHNAPTNNHLTKDLAEDTPAESIESPVENNSGNTDTEELPPVATAHVTAASNPKVESPVHLTSSQEETNTNVTQPSPSPAKVVPISYSTVILQTSDQQKTNKINTNTNSQQQRRQLPNNPQANQVSTKDRPLKSPPQQAQSQQQRGMNLSQNSNTRRRPPVKTNSTLSRTSPSTENNSHAKTQLSSAPMVVDEWIEVKSKKTKKFDRIVNESVSERFVSDEPTHASVASPLSLSSTGENTTTSVTSEDDFDEKDHNSIGVVIDNNVTNDYSQMIIDDIHSRLDQNERLLIIMRGCPGSGKSTLAKALNAGYNGVILSTDDYFVDSHTNEYVFDGNNLDDAHRSNHRRASEAFERNITPIIIDNTNTQVWEMKPYIAMGKEAGYEILLVEPQTPWRYKARELSKRNQHNLPLKRIKDMLSRFEHNVNVQNIIDQLPPSTKTNRCSSITEQVTAPKEKETVDSVSTSKKQYDAVDDSLILDDVRLCINDMILFLTSHFYQTALSSYTSILTNTTTTTTSSQPSTPLSVSFHDLSLLSSSPNSLPSTPTTPHGRFPRQLTRFPSTVTQDHAFNTEHLLRLPNTLTRCIDPINSNHFTSVLSTPPTLLSKKRRKNKNKATKSEQSENELLLNTNNNNNTSECVQMCSQPVYPTLNVFLAEDCPDYVVIDEQNENDCLDPLRQNDEQLVTPKKVLCSAASLKGDSPVSLSSSSSIVNSMVRRKASKTNRSANEGSLPVPTLREMALNALNRWNEEIKSTNPTFDSNSLVDLLDDINDGNLSLNTQSTSSRDEVDGQKIQLPWSTVNSLENLYGDLPNQSFFTSTSNGVILPVDDDLAINIHQAIERSVSKTSSNDLRRKPVNDNQKVNANKSQVNSSKSNSNQRWIIPSTSESTKTSQSKAVPSLKQIMQEEQRASKGEKSKAVKKRQLDSASEKNLRDLQRQFPSFDADLIFDIFKENQCNLELTFASLCTLLDDDNNVSQRPSEPMKTDVKPLDDLRRHVQRRKDFYSKARQANRLGLSGVASFYIHQAFDEAQLIKEANRRLTELQQTDKVDLRGLQADAALQRSKQTEKQLNKRDYKYSEASKGVLLLQLNQRKN